MDNKTLVNNLENHILCKVGLLVCSNRLLSDSNQEKKYTFFLVIK